MSWQDRLVEAAYTSPSGERITFLYENVTEEVEALGSAFNFPDAEGTFIQRTSNTGRRYPLRIMFSGNDYDLEASAFMLALLERGTGRLEHPIYGTRDVVPFGSISRRDDLKTAGNQAIFEVTFWETIGIVFPTAQADPSATVLSSVDEYNEAAAIEFEEIIGLDSATIIATFKNEYTAVLDATKSGLQAIADVQDDVRRQFDAITDSINNGLDILVDQPLTLALQTFQMIQAPARALAAIEARLSGYKDLADALTTGDDAVATTANEFRTKDLYASTYVTGSIISVVNNQFVIKTDALAAAEEVLAQFEAVNTWRDDNLVALSLIDTGGAYQQLQEAVAVTAGFLVEISFSLKQERRVVLDRARTIIDLVAELYGSIDDQLDFFISSNDLSGSEILELPRGREIVYYI